MLEWLPTWIFNVILISGIIGFIITYFFNFIPVVYKMPIQFISIVLIVFGTYMFGEISNQKSWLAKIKELEIKIAEAEAESAKETVKIVEKIVTNTQFIRQKNDEIIQYVDREIVKYDSKCEISQEVVDSLNQATEGLKK